MRPTPGATPREGVAYAATLSFPWRRLALGLAVVAVAGVLAAGIGSVSIPPLTVARILASKIPGLGVTFDGPASFDTILMQLRLPRIVLAGIVGGALAMSGAAYQGLFRNPLADPYLIGVAPDGRFASHHWRQLLSSALECTDGPNTMVGRAHHES